MKVEVLYQLKWKGNLVLERPTMSSDLEQLKGNSSSILRIDQKEQLTDCILPYDNS